jgi:hypothetical protein
MADTVALVQLARIYGLDRHQVTGDLARRTIAADPPRLAAAFFEEAAASDDVTSVESALDYLDGRLDFFGGLLDEDSRAAIISAFRDRLHAWEG